MKKSWLEPYVTALLNEKQDVLDSWRMQIPTLGGRTKNFENWFVVELIDLLVKIKNIQQLRTNGNLAGVKIKVSEVSGLKGKKSKGGTLSPDVAIQLDKHPFMLCAEIKTGINPGELFNDLKVVSHYRKIEVCKQAEFIWVTLLPWDEIQNQRTAKTHARIYQKMLEDNQGLLFIKKEITPWLILVIAVAV